MSPLLARQERAFERIYRRHVGDVYRYALVVLRDPQDAEDVTLTTFLNAYRGFRQGRRPRPALNSLLSIAHDVCRLRGSYPRLDDSFLVEEVAEPTEIDVRRALGRLPFDQRAALVMREVEGRSYAEIAGILVLSVDAVETLIFKARQHLREELEGSLTCHEAELAVSRELDDRSSRKERRLLRAHLRSCEECAAFAGGQHAQRVALRALALVPLPKTLESFFGSRRARIGMRTAARGGAITGVTLLVAALVSAGGIPGVDSFIGQAPEPAARAAVAQPTVPRPKKHKKAKRKVRRAAASP
jgi:RNA polymerase sigma factor (sigma-70 family)